MADNVAYTPGSGVNIAADGSNPDGALRQRIKVQTGTEGIANDVASGQAFPTFDDGMILRRILKVLETLSVVDPQQRQRITLDSITGALTLSTVTTVGTVTSVTNVATIAGMNDEQYINIARTAYNTGIRQHLSP